MLHSSRSKWLRSITISTTTIAPFTPGGARLIQRSKSVSPGISTRKRARLAIWPTINEYHEIMIFGIEQTTVKTDGTKDLLRSLLKVICCQDVARLGKKASRCIEIEPGSV